MKKVKLNRSKFVRPTDESSNECKSSPTTDRSSKSVVDDKHQNTDSVSSDSVASTDVSDISENADSQPKVTVFAKIKDENENSSSSVAPNSPPRAQHVEKYVNTGNSGGESSTQIINKDDLAKPVVENQDFCKSVTENHDSCTSAAENQDSRNSVIESQDSCNSVTESQDSCKVLTGDEMNESVTDAKTDEIHSETKTTPEEDKSTECIKIALDRSSPPKVKKNVIMVQGLSQNWYSFSLDGLLTPSIGIPTKRIYSVGHYLSNKYLRTSAGQIDLGLQLVL